MCLSGCADPKKPSQKDPVKKCAEGPNAGTSTSGNKITFVFDPDKSDKVHKCDRIAHVQFIRMYADGKVIKPGTYYSGYSGRDSATTGAGWYVDPSDPGFKSPDYQQSGEANAIGNDGKKGGGSTVKAKTEDAPTTGGGDKGFHDAATNPGGWKEVRYEFATFGYCMAGPDCGKWYEGLTWEYKKTSDDHAAGSDGTATITNKCVDAPSAEHLDAFDTFNNREGFKPCGK
jgi:hypothetical protein